MASSSSSLGSVFLSFRGIDTRRTLVGHLHQALVHRGITTFKDDVAIPTGTPFPEEILTSIQNSSFAIIVISKNFTSSKWCLIELQKIMELHTQNKIVVFPIFYGVEPSDLRTNGGHFLKPLKRHRRSPFAEEVPNWKEALKQVSYLHGKDPRKFNDDAAMIEDIVGEISTQLLSMLPIDFGDSIGMLPHMEKLDSLMNIRSKDVRMIGIVGMVGTGKTTIAKYLFDRYLCQFTARCFIPDVWEIIQYGGLVRLQEHLISSILPGDDIKPWSVEHGRRHIKYRLGHQSVFLVLDGVTSVDQIQAVAKDTSMFGQGSRIIITTRDKSLLRTCGLVEADLYEVQCLGSDDSLLMFKHYAFGEGGSPPSDAHEQLSTRASLLAYGLPCALEAFGLFFRGKTTISDWEEQLHRLETTPHEKTMEILKTSYNHLTGTCQNVFLHVACLFNGASVLRVNPVIDEYEYGTKELLDKSLVDISAHGYIKMHDFVEQTGQHIARLNQLILCDTREVCNVLKNNLGTGKIQCLALHMCEMSTKLAISCVNFKLMHRLNILKFYNHLDGIESRLYSIFENNLLSPDLELKMLHWDSYPSTTLPSELTLKFLVEINLRYSNLKELWDGTPELPKLRRLDVTGSKNLRRIPNLPIRLEVLLMNGCVGLKQYPNCGGSCYLGELHVNHCDGLRNLQINIRAQSKINTQIILEFPDVSKRLKSLQNLSIEGKITFQLLQLEGDADHFAFESRNHITSYKSTLRSRPSSICDFKYLAIKRKSYNKYSTPFKCLSFSDFPLLTELNLMNLKIENIPPTIGELQSLEKLNLSGNDFQSLPETMGKLSKLKYINLRNCCNLKALPQLTHVETLILSDCIELESLLELEEDCCVYICLLELELDNCNKIESLSEQLSHFTNLKALDLSRHDFSTMPDSIQELSSLRTLTMNNCNKLESIEDLPLSLKRLYAHGCYLLGNVSLSSDHSLEDFDLQHCFRLKLNDRLRGNEKVPPVCVCSIFPSYYLAKMRTLLIRSPCLTSFIMLMFFASFLFRR